MNYPNPLAANRKPAIRRYLPSISSIAILPGRLCHVLQIYFGNNILVESSQSSHTASEGDSDDDPSWWDDGDILVAIDLGFDEGGSGDKLVVGVQVAITEQAKKFKRNWKNRLGNVPYFHSVDFDNYTHGVFSKAGLDRKARALLLKDLAGLIHSRLIVGITARVSIAEYEQNTTQKFRSRYGTAYGFLIDMCMIGAYQIVKDHGLQPHFNILVESGHRNGNQVAQILTTLQGLSDEQWQLNADQFITDMRILTSGLGNKKEQPILQAADMLAYADWQSLSQGDAAIWDALHRMDVRYRHIKVNCDAQIIREFADPKKIARIRIENYDRKEQQRVPKIRHDDAQIDEGIAQRDQSQAGRGESSKKAEA